MATLTTPTGRVAEKATTTKSLSNLIDVDVFAAGGGLFGAMEEVASARQAGLSVELRSTGTSPVGDSTGGSAKDYANMV